MTVALPPLRRLLGPALAVLACSALPAAAEPGVDSSPTPRAAAPAPAVPPGPDGTPAELMAYIEALSNPAMMPTSRARRRYYLRRAAAATAEAAAKIRAQTGPDEALHQRALILELDALETLRQAGEPRAAAALAALADSLGDTPDRAVAARARRAAASAQIDAALASGRPEDAA
jgi:hypothetical protein